jgi:hypothetical protein
VSRDLTLSQARAETAKVIALDVDEYDLFKYVGTADAAVSTLLDMRRLGYKWARGGTFASNHEGPSFVYSGENFKTRYVIRPWKQATGVYCWRCYHPAMRVDNELFRFPTPLACAVAQEVFGE